MSIDLNECLVVQQEGVDDYLLQLKCRQIAQMYSKIKGNDATEDEIYTSLYNTELYNNKKALETDLLLDYNDQIESIEYLDEEIEMYDISVAGDQLFYANGVLTKNSFGLAHTADFLLGGIETDEMKAQGIQMFKQLKSRYGNKDINSKFNLGVMKGNQRWVELEESIEEPQITPSNSSSTRSKIDNMNLDDMKF